MSVNIMHRLVHTSRGNHSVLWEAGKGELWSCNVVFLCCILLAETCSAWKKNSTVRSIVFPLPHHPKRSEKHLFAWKKACKGLRVAFAEPTEFKEKSVVEVRPTIVPVLTCFAFFRPAQTVGWTATSCARTRWRSSARRTPKCPAPLTVQRWAPHLSPRGPQRVGLGNGVTLPPQTIPLHTNSVFIPCSDKAMLT